MHGGFSGRDSNTSTLLHSKQGYVCAFIKWWHKDINSFHLLAKDLKIIVDHVGRTIFADNSFTRVLVYYLVSVNT